MTYYNPNSTYTTSTEYVNWGADNTAGTRIYWYVVNRFRALRSSTTSTSLDDDLDSTTIYFPVEYVSVPAKKKIRNCHFREWEHEFDRFEALKPRNLIHVEPAPRRIQVRSNVAQRRQHKRKRFIQQLKA